MQAILQHIQCTVSYAGLVDEYLGQPPNQQVRYPEATIDGGSSHALQRQVFARQKVEGLGPCTGRTRFAG